MTAEQIAAGLTEAQRQFLASYPERGGRPHGLVARGLLRHRWGNDASFGYEFTILGKRVRAHLEKQP